MPEKRYISPLDFKRPASRSADRTRRLQVQKALGARIVQLRKKKQVSQEGLADSCGLHRSHMGEIERGASNVTLGTLLLLAKQLDITLSELFSGIAQL
jgi:DNA-binding XRE family transcriptional regulator